MPTDGFVGILPPNADRAVVAPEKLRAYVLSPVHPVGRFKAAFFAVLGYAQADWSRLASDLREQHLVLDASSSKKTPFGVKYLIEAPLRGPAGRSAIVASVWIVRIDVPELVTLYPGGRPGRSSSWRVLSSPTTLPSPASVSAT